MTRAARLPMSAEIALTLLLLPLLTVYFMALATWRALALAIAAARWVLGAGR